MSHKFVSAAAGLAAVAALGACASSKSPAVPRAAPPPAAAAAAAPPTTPASSAVPRAPGLRAVTLSLAAGTGAGVFSQPRRMVLPAGATAEVWARVAGARFEAWTPDGTLLVSQPGNGAVVLLTPRPGHPAAAPSTRIVLHGLTLPQGLAFDRIGGRWVLYVAESDRVDRYTWTGGRPAHRMTVVDGLPDTDATGDDVHRAKSIVVGPDHTLYVTNASSTNAGLADATKKPWPRGTILAMKPDGKDVHVFAEGIRNGEGLSFAPDDSLWVSVNNRDNIAYPFKKAYAGDADAFGKVIPGYVDDHPPEELARLTPGRDLGWPTCDPDPDVHRGVAGTAYRYARPPFTPDAQNNPGGSVRDCGKLAPIDRAIPAHSAPLGLHFVKHLAGWGTGALLAVHGSWNRQPPRAPGVVWLPWNAERHTLGAPVALVGGFQAADGTRWGRTVDAVVGPGPAIYVSDDTAGAVYRVTLKGS